MPAQKRQLRKKNVHPYKKAKRSNQDSKVPRSLSLSDWKTPIRTTMRYSDAAVLATTISVGFVTYTLRANSLFDPDLQGIGHQPLRFDQMAAMFNSYRVRSASIKCHFSHGDITSSTSSLGPWRVCITKSKTNSTLPGTGTDQNTAAEMEGSRLGVLTTQESVTLYNNYSWNDSGVDDISQLNTLVTTNPAAPNDFYWILSCFNEGQVAATNVLANFDISFDCEFLNPKTIATS